MSALPPAKKTPARVVECALCWPADGLFSNSFMSPGLLSPACLLPALSQNISVSKKTGGRGFPLLPSPWCEGLWGLPVPSLRSWDKPGSSILCAGALAAPAALAVSQSQTEEMCPKLFVLTACRKLLLSLAVKNPVQLQWLNAWEEKQKKNYYR